jgi:hypothetical protein
MMGFACAGSAGVEESEARRTMLTNTPVGLLEAVAGLCLVLLASWRLWIAAGKLDALYRDEDAVRARHRRQHANRAPHRLPAWRLQQRCAWRRLIAALHLEAHRCARLCRATVPHAWPGPRRMTYPSEDAGTRAMRLYAHLRTHPLLRRLACWRMRATRGGPAGQAATRSLL